MACDGATFANLLGPVVWLRDANARTINAYTVPSGVCPLASLTHYFGPDHVNTGATAKLCATLGTRTLFTQAVLTGQPMAFWLNGKRVGDATTDLTGTVCLPTQVNLPTGRYRVEAAFGGNREYVSSGDQGWLDVGAPAAVSQYGPQVLAGLPLGGAAAPPGASPANGAIQTSAQINAQSQIQTEAQAQAQSQAQSQSVAQAQPGLMVQRQKRTQIATQEQSAGVNVQYQARALAAGKRSATPAVAITAGMLLGFGLLRRAARVEVARRRAGGRRGRRLR